MKLLLLFLFFAVGGQAALLQYKLKVSFLLSFYDKEDFSREREEKLGWTNMSRRGSEFETE